jgi:hypothetical protein
MLQKGHQFNINGKLQQLKGSLLSKKVLGVLFENAEDAWHLMKTFKQRLIIIAYNLV